MRLTMSAALVALTTLTAATGAQAQDSFFDRLLGRVEAPVHGINTRLNRLTGQAEGGSVQQIVSQEAAAAGVPNRLAHAVIKIESGYNCRAKNPHSSASGAGQLTRGTARAMGVRNVFNCRDNIRGAMRYLRAAINRGGAGCAGVSLYNRGIGARPSCTAYGRKIMRTASL
ncbi:lytic transglycosylase domain-containing protein [Methylobacterium sp. AMS5]|uniref:lytic transglycosylase domain-containing protein n=1 Tax=Methylobacterium sp. AMS5 TaxID=925818 RepID=UPI00074FAAA5|nr:lytic transglycosylase domain-containing protein [Methylobacterium sp. AMS5]AMB48330.1 murein transglycosylase [Methylobacterium sp. AMS5]